MKASTVVVFGVLMLGLLSGVAMADDVVVEEVFEEGEVDGKTSEFEKPTTKYGLNDAVFREGCKGEASAKCVGMAHYHMSEEDGQDLDRAMFFADIACDEGNTNGCTLKAVVVIEKGNVTQGVSTLMGQCMDDQNALACSFLARFAFKGEHGVEGGKERAAMLYDKACEYGDMVGCSSLGSLYMKGEGVEKNEPTGVRLYRKACLADDAISCYSLAVHHETKVKHKLAGKFYTKACEMGHYESCMHRGRQIRDNKGASATDTLKDAAEFYHKACEDGQLLLACTDLGNMLLEGGLGLKRDFSRARQLFENSCKGEDAGACTSLGLLYDGGSGVKEDATRAAELYSKACNLGDPLGCGALGVSYAEGTGVLQNLSVAREFLKQGCKGGAQVACDYVKTLEKKGVPPKEPKEPKETKEDTETKATE